MVWAIVAGVETKLAGDFCVSINHPNDFGSELNDSHAWRAGNLERVFVHAGGLLLFLMLYTPRANAEFKIPFLLFSLFGGLMAVAARRAVVHPFFATWFILYLFFGVVWSAVGMWRGNPGVDDYFRLNVVWTLVYLPLVLAIYRIELVHVLLRYALAALLAIAVFNIALVLNELGWMPSNPLLQIDMGANVGIHGGYVQLTSHNIGSLAFLVPLFMAKILVPDAGTKSIETRITAAVLVISAVAVLLSGRRAIWLVIVCTPILIWLFARILPPHHRRRVQARAAYLILVGLVLITLLIAALHAYADWDLEATWGRATQFLSDDDGVRAEQASALLGNLRFSPFFGTGFGQGVREVVRDLDRPWSYELFYLQMLFNVGIVGMFVYVLLLAAPMVGIASVSRRDIPVLSAGYPLLVGYTTFIIASASNPYLGSFDFLCVVFLTVAAGNVGMVRKARSSSFQIAESRAA